MKKWEYRVRMFKMRSTASSMEAELSMLGAEGWRVISVVEKKALSKDGSASTRSSLRTLVILEREKVDGGKE